jgi:hypothetical protein
MIELRIRLQLAEAFGPINRWFCSQAFGRHITDLDLLLMYYIKSGGAADFAARFNEAMGQANRWYCSEFYRRDTRDPDILWEYYTNIAPARALVKNPRFEPPSAPSDLNIAC